MRGILLAVVAIQIGLAHPVRAQTAPDSSRPISEVLPLFGKNHCEDLRDPAEQLFCGDPELNAVSPKLAGAIQDRMNRLPTAAARSRKMPDGSGIATQAARFLEGKPFAARTSHPSKAAC